MLGARGDAPPERRAAPGRTRRCHLARAAAASQHPVAGEPHYCLDAPLVLADKKARARRSRAAVPGGCAACARDVAPLPPARR